MNKFLLFLILPVFAFSQIINPGFENWTNGEPDGWWTLNIPGFAVPVTQSSDAQSGSSALRGEVKSLANLPYTPWVSSGSASYHYFTIDQNYTSLKGYIKFSSHNKSEQFYGSALVYSVTGADTIPIAAGYITSGENHSNYTSFEMPIEYTPGLSNQADLISITFTISAGADSLEIGTNFLLDNLSLSTVTGLEKHLVPQPETFSLKQNYPNPFNPSTKISYQIAENSMVSLKVYDVNGREVADLFNGRQSAGSYSVNFDGSTLPSGVYFYRLTTGSFSKTKRMLLVK